VLIASVDREIRRESREIFEHASQRSPHRQDDQFVTFALNLNVQSGAIAGEFIGDTNSV